MLGYAILNFFIGIVSFVTAPLRWMADILSVLTDDMTMSIYNSMELFVRILNGLIAELPFMRIVWSFFWVAVGIKFIIWIWEKWIKWFIERVH